MGAGCVHIDANGDLVAAWASASYDQPRLRRAQAKAFGTPEALAISKGLIEEKLAGQQRTLEHLRLQRES